MSYYYGWKPYVPVAQRRRKAQKEMERLRKRGDDIQPVEIVGRKIAATFWGKAWCDHMETQGDYANRLPRGRTYVRNGSVCHLAIARGRIKAKVSGSEIYNVSVSIDVLSGSRWQRVQQQCQGRIGSLMELLTGKISAGVMEVVTDRNQGLFPSPKEIKLSCDCPDYATMCKHAAAVLYGVGARLDHQPELLFLLRGVDHLELIAPADEAVSAATNRGGSRRQVAADDLGAVFGIDLEADDTQTKPAARKTKRKATTARKPGKRAKSSNQPAATSSATSGADVATDSTAAKKTSNKAAAKKKTPKKRMAKKRAAKKRAAKKKAAKKKTAKRSTLKKQSADKQPTINEKATKKSTVAKKNRVAKRKTTAKKKTAAKQQSGILAADTAGAGTQTATATRAAKKKAGKKKTVQWTGNRKAK